MVAGQRYAVYFWGANTTKALHIGHLRNLAIGNAIGATLTQAGGAVEHRSLICDVGRSMGEAMAGIVEHSGRDQPNLGPDGSEKSDHFVGTCYAQYVTAGRQNGDGEADGAEDSVAREEALYNDKADELMMRVLAGDQEALELWSKTRAWVIAGQRKTLARLGIPFDKVIFESDFLPEVREFTNQGLSEGTLTRRRGDEMVMYLTAREELEEMPLVRADGLPTQHMRALAYWAAAPELDDVISLQVCGTEWVAHVTCRRQLIDALGAANGNGHGSAKGGGPPTHDVFHGMVAREKEAITSTKEGALLIDDLAEWIESEIEADPARAAVRAAHPRAEGLPAQVALGYFLAQPMSKRVDFEPEKLLADGNSLGWDLARAQARRGGRAPLAGRQSRRRPAVPLRRRPVGELPSPPAQRGRDLRHPAAGPLPLPSRSLVRGGGALAGGRAGDPGGAGPGSARPRAGGGLMRTLLVDNHDSYSYNVFHLLAAACGEEPVVVNNDAVSWRVLSRENFDAIVLSPGPGRPERWHDFGVCRDILSYSEIPVLGICLGHQGIGNLLHGGVNRAPMAMHGRLSRIRHDGTGLFEGVPQDFEVVRYHSLAITSPMGPEGRETAWSEDGVVMGIEHSQRPMWGVQFHPESVATEHGRKIAENFYTMAERHGPTARRRAENSSHTAEIVPSAPGARGRRGRGGRSCRRGGCWCGASRARRRPSSSTNASSPTPRPPSGSTAPTPRPGSPSARSSAPAPAATAACSNTTSTPAR